MKTSLYPVAILAGGLATRLRPLTQTIPKALVSINEEPFIHHQLRLLHRHGIREIVLCVHYLGEMIEQHLGNGRQFGVNIRYSYDGDTPYGTAGAIKKALSFLGENFFVLYGDSYLDCDYQSIQQHFMQSKQQGLMTVFHNQGQWDISNVEYANGNIIAYDKKNITPRMHHIDYGVGLFKQSAFQIVPDHEPYDLALLYQSLLKNQQLAAFEVSERFYEVGSFAGIKELEYYLSL